MEEMSQSDVKPPTVSKQTKVSRADRELSSQKIKQENNKPVKPSTQTARNTTEQTSTALSDINYAASDDSGEASVLTVGSVIKKQSDGNYLL